MKLNTIDFDFNDKKLISKVLGKIWNCDNLFSCKCEMSQHKGCTITLNCRIDCDLCRFVFDDEIRYNIDSQRLKRHQNIVWDKKEILPLKERLHYGK